MGLINPYSHDDRKASRNLIKKLDNMASQAEAMARGRLEFNPKFVAGLAALTDTADLESQHRALTAMAAHRREWHLGRLYDLGRDDLTAFAEAMSPHEPPAPHLIYVAERLMEIEGGDRDRLILSMPPGHAKDLDVETPVMMGDGSWKRLGDVEIGNTVITMHGRPREVLAVHEQGTRPVLKIMTESGRTIRAHPDHLFLTPMDWIAAKDLSVGSMLGMPRNYSIQGRDRYKRDEFVFAGYMMARAIVTGRSYSRLYRITNKFRGDDPIIINEVKAIASRLGFNSTQKREVVRQPGTRSKRVDIASDRDAVMITFDDNCIDWLTEMDLWQLHKDEVRVPEWIFKGTDDSVAAFLGAILSCDATFRPTASKTVRGRYHTLSLRILENAGLAQDLIRLFQRLGIKASVTVSTSLVNYKPSLTYRLAISETADQVLVKRRIPLTGITRRFWEMPIETTDWQHPDFIPDPIISITPDGETETRCLTVEEDSSFLADGIIVHNSTYASRYYPAWYLGRKENRLYLQGGHTGDFAEKEFGRKTKDIVLSDPYRRIFPDVSVRFDAKANADWMLTNGNRYVTKGVNEGISGFRSTNNGIDDPYPSFRDAQNPKFRQKVWDWFTNDFMTRLLPSGNAFVISCLTAETPVSMADGSYKPICDVRPGDLVWAWKEGIPVIRRVTNFADQGEDDIFEVRTGNSNVRGNSRHPFLVKREDETTEWVRLSDLQVGDRVVTSAALPDSTLEDGGVNSGTISETQAWLLGFMFGDGWITKRDAIQSNKVTGNTHPRRGFVTCAAIKANEETNSKVLEAFLTVFGVVPKKTKYGYIRTDIARIGRWFTEHGLTGTAHTKRVPAFLFGEPLNIREAFLSGYVAADGHVAATGKDGAWPRVVVTSCNEGLISDMRHIARGVGFNVTNINTHHFTGYAPNSPAPTKSVRVSFAYAPHSKTDAFFRENTIRSIKPVGRAVVYDIAVEDAECFIADGLVTHNTRWHMDDVIGRLIEMMEEGDNEIGHWEFINLPIFCVEPEIDPLGRALGEALWPDFYTEQALRRQKAIMTPQQWAALYEGEPVPMEGNIIKTAWISTRYKMPPLLRANTVAGSLYAEEHRRQLGRDPKNSDEAGANLPGNSSGDPADSEQAGENRPAENNGPRIIEHAPPFIRTVISVDSAEKDTERADYTAITVWRETIDRRHYLIDAHRERMEFPRLVACVDDMARRWGADVVLMETKGAGNQYIQHVNADTDHPRDFVVVPIDPGRDGKIFRMDMVTPMFMGGLVVLPERATWLTAYERELLQFPGSKNDDFADATSQYLKWVRVTGAARRGTKKLR